MGELEQARPAAINAVHKSYLFWGPGGTGKTTFMMKHPGKRKLVLDLDGKLAEQENLAKADFEGVEVWAPGEELTESDRMVLAKIDRAKPSEGRALTENRTYARTVAVVNELISLAAQKKFPYDLVALDSLTRLNDALILSIMWRHGTGIMTEGLWGVFRNNMLDFITKFVRLPCARIVIAHEKDDAVRDKQGEVVEAKWRPFLHGSLRNDLNTYFSEAYYFNGRALVVDGKNSGYQYTVQTATDDKRPARTTKGLDSMNQPLDPIRIYGVS